MIYYINYKKNQENNAGNKAPDDISKICNELGYEEFLVPSLPNGLSSMLTRLWILFHGPIWWKQLRKKVKKMDVVIYQHPMYGSRLALKMITKIKKDKGCKFVAVVHDLESLRNGVEGEYQVKSSTSNIADNQLLRLFDKVICHNESMQKYLVDKGFDNNKLIDLQIFDYLCDTPYNSQEFDLSKVQIAIAGNLSFGKSGYIYELGSSIDRNSKIQINVYGSRFDFAKATESIVYKGSFDPDILPEVLEGNFGLVWDGSSAKSCIGNTGNYLKYNDPHKTSLYLASGIPVIVWKEAAIADFVINNKVGFAVSSLMDLNSAIATITVDEYRIMKNNAVKVGKKLRSGYFTKKAFESAIKE